MKIDNAVESFLERYDKEAMGYIDRLANNFGANANRRTVKLFNITEAFDAFTSYLNGYGKYRVSVKDNDDEATPQKTITESTDAAIKDHMIKEVDMLYSQIPSFVKGYAEGVQKLQTSIQKLKQYMLAEGVKPAYVGDVSVFADKFIERLNESFFPAMDYLLAASGYTADKNIRTIAKPTPKPVFL